MFFSNLSFLLQRFLSLFGVLRVLSSLDGHERRVLIRVTAETSEERILCCVVAVVGIVPVSLEGLSVLSCRSIVFELT